jgi:hypothetical protein
MEAEQLWEELHYLFDTDDGSLPEISIMNLSKDGVVAIFSYLQCNCHNIANNASFWSIEDQQDKPIDSVPNAAALVVQRRAEPFHFVCEGLAYMGQVIPDIGVFVFDDQINLDYQMGQEWNATKLKALFGILKDLKRIEAGAKVSIEHYALPKVRKHFETTWERFLQATEEHPLASPPMQPGGVDNK